MPQRTVKPKPKAAPKNLELPELALSIRQPYAQLVLTPSRSPGVGIKWIENRSWLPPKTFLDNGPRKIAIHTGMTKVSAYGIDEYEYECERHRQPSTRLRHSAILGTVDVVGFVSPDWDDYCGDDDFVEHYRNAKSLLKAAGLKLPRHGDEYAAIGSRWWIFANPVLFPKPIPCQGKLNLWFTKHLQK